MCVVDDRERLAGGDQRLHASRRRAAALERRERIVERHVPAEQRTQRREQILDVEVADEARAQRRDAPAAVDGDVQARCASEPHAPRTGDACADPASHDRSRIRREVGSRRAVAQQRAPERIVGIDDRMLQLRPREQLGLRSSVALERAVIVQVIARQVGEHRGIEAHPVDAVLVERVRRHFHRETSHACVAQFGELTVHRDGIRGRVRPCLQCIDAAEAERARVRGSRAEQLRRSRDDVRGCRLAVRASHADRAHRLRRRAEEAIGDRAENRGEIRHGEQQHAVGHARRGDTRCRLPQDRSCARRSPLELRSRCRAYAFQAAR